MPLETNDQDPSFAWEIHSSDLRITESPVVMLPISKLSPHPDNRPLGSSEEKIRQLKVLIAHHGFDASHPLVVRTYQNSYQIIEGEHRFTAAKALGYLKLPCVVRELTDTEALIQLVLGNIQTETKPLEIGINALKVGQKEGKAFTIQSYSQRLGISETTVRRYMNASEVFQYLKTQLPEGVPVLDEVIKLEEIHRCPQADWFWLYDLVVKNELSKNQVIEITQATREIKTDNPAVFGLFDLLLIRQNVAQEILQGNKSATETHQDLLQTVESSLQNLDEIIKVYEYNVLNDSINGEEVNLREWFIINLKELKNLTKQAVLEAYKDALQLKRSGSIEEAERTASYFRDKKNNKEREEQERIERQMRQVREGEWWQLGSHLLYCGEGASQAFYQKIPAKIALAYCNPPYLTEITTAENTLGWNLDVLIHKAEVVAVTPEIDQLQKFLKLSRMPYRWSMCAQLSLKKTDSGLGSWVYTALFSNRAIDTRVKDHWKIDGTDLQGSKTHDFLKHLVESFTREHEIVVDIFAGIGTMFLVAEETHRVCYGAEPNPHICKDLIEKWEEMSKGKAIKVS
jgi:ParB/RepB/Spo0J family partition protein